MAGMTNPRIEIGVIADTHGLLRPEAVRYLKGCHYILHAGDVGKEAVLEELKAIAPTFAVRGNVDRDSWAEGLPHREMVKIGNRCFYLVHNIEDLELDPSDGFDVVVYGHSHIPKIYWKKGVSYFNPGGAGPKRFKLPVSMGRIVMKDHRLESRIVNLL
ncbi:MAG: metallophosphoesterase family protein [Deltaproteobacteria bacterium]|nr:metallophosphoesterase family protein [Deltaproteobacteria bacterium]